MHISDMLGQYNRNISSGTEELKAASGMQKVVSTMEELSSGSVFEGTVSSVKNGKVTLALSDGQTITARLSGKVPLSQGTPMFFQVKSNDGVTIEIKPYTGAGSGGNPILTNALTEGTVPVTERNLAMVDAMMKEQMPIDKTSLNQMYQLVQDNKDINVTTLVELKRLGIEINQVNAAQFENYANDKQAITIAMDSLIDELPNALSAEDLSMYKLVTQARDILNIVTEGLTEEAFISSEASDMSQYEAIIRDNQSAPVVKKHFNIAELFESLNSVSGESQDIHTTQKINNAPATDTILLQENETKSNTIGFLLSDKQIEELNEQVRMLLPDLQENNISLYSEDSSVVGILNDIKSMLENTPANADTLRHLFSGEAFKLMLKEALEQQWMIKPGDLEKNPKKLDGLYDKIEKQITNMEIILKTSGVVNPKAEALADNIRGNIEFMNQINEAYTYVQVPLKMNEKNASGQLYVYTNKKSMSNPDKELSAFLHLDLEHLGGTDVSIKMLHRKVTTNFYLDSDESYALVKQFLPVLEKRLQDKGYNCELNVNSGLKQMNFVAGFLKKDLPPTGQVHRYSFDIRA